ncbi:SDR family NAD(P)-dependent oxidoreductase [Paenibacillus sp. SAFN-117]|uniref:SDR family NAD(P)-dependent oxidoreductase n=1 Tax=Paenibacillus sp. SAFN-117 TaxID=3436860 RepID=UPI003F7D0762
MPKSIAGQIIVVTGASSGIGELLSRKIAAEGAFPVMMARSEDKLRQISEEIQEEHEWMPVDVRDEDQVNRAMAQVLSKHGRIDVLVNNAGYGIFERLEDASMSSIEDMMDVNYFGTVRCIKAVLPHMMKAGSGQIVNIASMAGKVGSAKSTGYSATKHAVLGFTNCLRQELAGTGITVSSVNPGPIDTPFFDRADPSGQYVKNISWFMLKPEQVVQAIIQVIHRKKAEVDLPFVAGLGSKMYQLFPRWADRLFASVLNRK